MEEAKVSAKIEDLRVIDTGRIGSYVTATFRAVIKNTGNVPFTFYYFFCDVLVNGLDRRSWRPVKSVKIYPGQAVKVDYTIYDYSGARRYVHVYVYTSYDKADKASLDWVKGIDPTGYIAHKVAYHEFKEEKIELPVAKGDIEVTAFYNPFQRIIEIGITGINDDTVTLNFSGTVTLTDMAGVEYAGWSVFNTVDPKTRKTIFSTHITPPTTGTFLVSAVIKISSTTRKSKTVSKGAYVQV